MGRETRRNFHVGASPVKVLFLDLQPQQDRLGFLWITVTPHFELSKFRFLLQGAYLGGQANMGALSNTKRINLNGGDSFFPVSRIHFLVFFAAFFAFYLSVNCFCISSFVFCPLLWDLLGSKFEGAPNRPRVPAPLDLPALAGQGGLGLLGDWAPPPQICSHCSSRLFHN